MNFVSLKIPEVKLIKPEVFGDERGFFMETYHQKKFSENAITVDFVQDNHSGSTQSTLRGLHYQIQQAQGKLVRCVAGEVYDVAVDLRRSSPTFGHWVGETLTAENKHMLWIPEGFAHGFYVLSKWGELAYKATDFYAPQWERSLRWNDPEIGIKWPLLPDKPLLMSEKDSLAVLFTEAEVFD